MLIFHYFIKNNSKVKKLLSLLAKIDYQISSDFAIINSPKIKHLFFLKQKDKF